MNNSSLNDVTTMLSQSFSTVLSSFQTITDRISGVCASVGVPCYRRRLEGRPFSATDIANCFRGAPIHVVIEECEEPSVWSTDGFHPLNSIIVEGSYPAVTFNYGPCLVEFCQTAGNFENFWIHSIIVSISLDRASRHPDFSRRFHFLRVSIFGKTYIFDDDKMFNFFNFFGKFDHDLWKDVLYQDKASAMGRLIFQIIGKYLLGLYTKERFGKEKKTLSKSFLLLAISASGLKLNRPKESIIETIKSEYPDGSLKYLLFEYFGRTLGTVTIREHDKYLHSLLTLISVNEGNPFDSFLVTFSILSVIAEELEIVANVLENTCGSMSGEITKALLLGSKVKNQKEFIHPKKFIFPFLTLFNKDVARRIMSNFFKRHSGKISKDTYGQHSILLDDDLMQDLENVFSSYSHMSVECVERLIQHNFPYEINKRVRDIELTFRNLAKGESSQSSSFYSLLDFQYSPAIYAITLNQSCKQLRSLVTMSMGDI